MKLEKFLLLETTLTVKSGVVSFILQYNLTMDKLFHNYSKNKNKAAHLRTAYNYFLLPSAISVFP